MVELSVPSYRKGTVKSQIEERVSELKQNFKQPTGKVLQNAEVKAFYVIDSLRIFVYKLDLSNFLSESGLSYF